MARNGDSIWSAVPSDGAPKATSIYAPASYNPDCKLRPRFSTFQTGGHMSNISTASAEDAPLANWVGAVKPSELQEMLSRASRPGIISFALGLPAPEFFPREALSRAAASVLANDMNSLQYGPPSRLLKRQIVGLMAQRGVECHEGQIFLTSGAQQGMNLLARLLLDAGGQVLSEEMIYTGFQQVVEPYQPRLLTVPTDPETGMDVASVESILDDGHRPAFIYAIS